MVAPKGCSAATTEKFKEVGARMRAARERLSLNQSQFYDRYVAKTATLRSLQRAESGSNESGMMIIECFASAGINTNWLLTGEGEMLSAQVYAVNQPRAEYTVARPQPQIDVTLLTAIIAAVDMANPSLSHAERASIAAKAYAESLAPKASL